MKVGTAIWLFAEVGNRIPTRKSEMRAIAGEMMG